MYDTKDLKRKLNEYYDLSIQIKLLKSDFSKEKMSISNEKRQSFEKLKKELENYFVKILPTIKIICSTHDKLRLSNNKILLNDQEVRPLQYNIFNAEEIAKKMGNATIMVISKLLKITNRQECAKYFNEFAKDYNTVSDIYCNIEKLLNSAIDSSITKYENEINALEIKKSYLFKSEKEYLDTLTRLTDHSYSLYNKLLNKTLVLNNEFCETISIPFGAHFLDYIQFGIDYKNDVFLSHINEWDFQKKGIMHIKTSAKDEKHHDLIELSINTILYFLFAYPGNSKQVLLCDSSSNQHVTSFAGILKSGNADLFFGGNGSFVKNNEDDIKETFSELNRIINERIMLLGQSQYQNILEYNTNNQDNPQPLIMVSLNGFSSKYENSIDEIFSALKNGQQAGVFFIINENVDGNDNDKYYRKSMPDMTDLNREVYEFKVVNGVGYIHDGKDEFISNLRGKNFNMESLINCFNDAVKSSVKNVIYLDSVVGDEDFNTSERRHKYSEMLSIPIGKQGAKPINIDLSAKDAPHIAVIGTTGSGKTAFINSLVLSACKLYSPEELELHLIVMVKGDFRVFEEEKLPHLKTVVTGDKIYAANDVLDFIDEEMKRRGELIGSLGNIYAYNEVAEKPLPRCMIIIDEFYQLVQGSDEAIERINRIAQVGRAYGIGLVISSIRFPMEVNSLIPLFEHKIEFKSKENAGQLIPEVANRQSELEAANGLCFYSCKGNLYSVRVAFSEEGDVLKNHIVQVRHKFPQHEMVLQSEIKPFVVNKESDVLFNVKRAKSDYDEEGIVRTRLGKTYLSNKSLEYPFESKNNLLFLFGHYLETKQMEASLIKDTLVLSKHIDEPTVFYIDMNRNASLKRAKTIIKQLRDKWVLSGKMVFATNDEYEDTFSDIKDLIRLREEDDESEIYPVLVVISKAESIFEDDDMSDELLNLITKGKECNIYFVLQCNEMISFYGSDKYIKNAIIFPDRDTEGEVYSSAMLCSALDSMPAGATDKGKKLISTATLSSLHPKLHLLCNNNKLSIFVPYDYSFEYLESIVD